MTLDPQRAWEAYRPSAVEPWNLQRVGHLYRRAAFGATWTELQMGVDAGPTATLEKIFIGGKDGPAFPESILRGNNGPQMVAWWIKRLAETQHPLREKVALFWHNHFATSNAKVNNARQMVKQYSLFYDLGLGSFRRLLQEVSIDPAMLVWLDTVQSRKGMPNENYARELMELFSLGIGNYTEADIREAAKAFTGWIVNGAEVTFVPNLHDGSEKTVFGKTGKFQAREVVDLCLDRPTCPRFVLTKLFRYFVSETLPIEPGLLEPLERQYRASDFDTHAIVRTMLQSKLFFSDAALRTRVKSPVSFALGMVRSLEGNVSATQLAASLEALGQRLFYPPSVKGWDGGQAWLNAQTLLFRQNFALALTSTADDRFKNRCDPAELAAKHGKKGDAELVEFFLDLFLQGEVPAERREQLLAYTKQKAERMPAYWTSEDAAQQRVRSLCHLVLTLPEYQLD